jgi:hypothetical protein
MIPKMVTILRKNRLARRPGLWHKLNPIVKPLSAKALCLTALLLLGPATAMQAQSYEISWYKIAGGGGTSTNGSYSLSGTIGQVDAGTMSGGGYTLAGGFWGIFSTVQVPGSPFLSITRSGSNVILSWLAASTGFVLQENPVVNSTNWSNVGLTTNVVSGTNEVTVPATTGNLFFRLVNP